MAKSKSDRILSTPSAYARNHFLYVQEVGSLESIEPHISQRQNLSSYLFFIVTSGSGTFSYHGKTHFLPAGSCVWIDCRKPYAHESSIEEPWTLMWLHFDGKQADDYYRYFLEQGNHFIFMPFDQALFTDCLSSIYQLQKNPAALSELICNQYIIDIMTNCFRENKQELTSGNSISDKLQQIRSYLDLHAAEKISLDQLSEQFFISKYHLAREYKKAYGTTIGNTLIAKRVSLAKSMLRFSSDPITQIFFRCGFSDAAYFIKVFKKEEGMTPLEYRKKW